MGNSNSQVQNDINDLKKLYAMNKFEMEALRKELQQERQKNTKINEEKQRLYNIVKTQNNLKGRISDNKFKGVNNFLNDIHQDIKSHENRVPVWTPSVSQPPEPSPEPSPERFQPQYHDRMRPQMSEQRAYYDRYAERQSQERQPLRQSTSQQSRQQNEEPQEIDIYQLYGFKKNQKINLGELKDKYKTYAMQTHPDKNNGNMKNFQIVTNAYKKLIEIYKTQQDDKQYTELKNSSLSYLEDQSRTNKRNTKFDNKNFDVNKFNTIFSDNRIEDPSNQGYGDWIDSNKFDSDSITRRTDLNTGNFNKYFNSDVKCGQELTKYRDPSALEMNNFNSYKLGEDKVDNYSGKTTSISFTDYKEAHTTSRLVDPNTKFKTYRNVGELENSRANIKDFTAEEIEQYEMDKLRQQEKEDSRINNLRAFDDIHFKNYDKVHNIMLNM